LKWLKENKQVSTLDIKKAEKFLPKKDYEGI